MNRYLVEVSTTEIGLTAEEKAKAMAMLLRKKKKKRNQTVLLVLASFISVALTFLAGFLIDYYLSDLWVMALTFPLSVIGFAAIFIPGYIWVLFVDDE